MQSSNSLYRCYTCGRESEGTPGIRKCCLGCNSVMVEIRKGIINKVAEPEIVKEEDDAKPARKARTTRKRKAK